MDAQRRGLILITVSAVSFGGVAVLGKLALLAGMSVPALLFWRWLFAAVAIAPVAFLRRRRGDGPRLTRRLAAGGLALGFFGYAGTSGIYFAALPHVQAALASFLLYINPVFVALLSAALLGERLRGRGLAALAIAVGGLALLTLAPDARASALGVALALASAVVYALTIVAGRRLVTRAPPLEFAFLNMVGAAAAFLVAAVATGTLAPPPTATTWGHVLLLGVVSTAVSVGLFFVALPLIGAPRAALVSTLEPVSTVFLAWIVLDETFTLAQLAGAALVLAAVVTLASEKEPLAAGPAVG